MLVKLRVEFVILIVPLYGLAAGSKIVQFIPSLRMFVALVQVLFCVELKVHVLIVEIVIVAFSPAIRRRTSNKNESILIIIPFHLSVVGSSF